MQMSKAIIAVLVMAVVTYIPRALPLVFYRKKINSKWVRSFLYYVPYSVLGAMIFPAILNSTNNIITSIAGLTIAIILSYLGKGLMQVATYSILSVYICEKILILLSIV